MNESVALNPKILEETEETQQIAKEFIEILRPIIEARRNLSLQAKELKEQANALDLNLAGVKSALESLVTRLEELEKVKSANAALERDVLGKINAELNR